MTPEDIAFAADMMVGRLARWLRILGYDTLYNPEKSVQEWIPTVLADDRILLTRNRKIAGQLPAENYYFVAPNDPREQVRDVLEKFQLDTEHFVFRLCVPCNVPVVSIAKEAVFGQVPPLVFETHHEFWQCPACGKIYWRGSHLQRVGEFIKKIRGSNARF
ncbi:MAG: hypothetical protein GXO76_15520 [Calditrichaeota bacterium]|nr:hypothetical protein [Calditrichota bacterium]